MITRKPAPNTPPAGSNGKPAGKPSGGYRRLKIPWGWVSAAIVVLLLLFNVIQAKINAVPPLPEGLIQANGRIEGDHVIVSSKYSGRIVELRAREGDSVKAGQLLMSVSDPETTARRDQAQATLNSVISEGEGAATSVRLAQQNGSALIMQAQGQLGQAESQIEAARADAVRAKAGVGSAEAARNVAKQNILVARSALDTARANGDRAHSALAGAKASLEAAQASLGSAQASVDSAKAAADQAVREAKRYRHLADEGAVSAETAERAQTASAQNEAAYEAAKHQVMAAGANVDSRSADYNAGQDQIRISEAAVRQAAAQLTQSRQQAKAAESALEGAVAQASISNFAVVESEQRRRQAEGQLKQALTASTQVLVSQKNSESAASRIRQARAALDEIQSTLDQMAVTSPIAGTVVTRFQDQGELVSTGSPVLELVNLDKLYLQVYVPEKLIGKLRRGLPAQIFTDAFPKEPFSAKVGYISAQAEFTPKEIQTAAERVSLVYAVRLYLESNPSHRLTPGMQADAIIKWKGEAAWVSPR